MSGITCIAEEDGNVYHLNIGIRELRLPKGYRLNIAGYGNPGSVTVEKWEQPWTGKGLPPVGTVCEIKLYASWTQVLVIAHYVGQPVVAWACAEGENVELRDVSELRPTRTPEQLAQQQRVAAIQAMVDDSGFDGETDNVWPSMEALYNAGYRKVQP